ncbi:MAG: RHS repeat protein [Coprobacter sp.]|nr:RHS repeat protein [Coprobacter sp.]
MKRLFTSLSALLIAVPFFAQAPAEAQFSTANVYSWQEGTDKPADPSSTYYKFYDAAGNAVAYQQYSGSYTVYDYNADGKMIKSQGWSSDWNTGAYIANSYTIYEYDAEGQLIKQTSYNTDDEVNSYVFYEGYEKGQYRDMKSVNKDGVTISYWRSYDHVFTGDQLTYSVAYYCTDSTRNKLDSTAYAYDVNGRCISSAQYAWDSANGVYTTPASMTYTYEYDATGRLAKATSASSSRWGVYLGEEAYTYAALSADYVPANLTVSNKSDALNTVIVTWDAPKNTVSGYRVFFDGVLAEEITATSYESPVLKNGTHTVAVVSVADGEIKNISDFKVFSVNDPGIKAPTEFALVEFKDTTMLYGSAYYNATVSWKAPETTSPITGYRVYYSEYGYVDVYDPAATSTDISVSSWSAVTNGEDGEEGVNLTMYVVAQYATGNSEPSNKIIANLYDKVTFEPVQSTRVELSPLYADAANSDAATWKFTNTDITITNVDAKTYASTGIYTDANGVATAREFMKMSRGKKWTLVVPEDRAVVRIEFWGFSNSSAMNWAYLRYVTNPAVEVLADVSPEGQVKENETIKAYAHPFSPEAVTAEAAPLAVFVDQLGWFGELSFYFDGNNQVGANIVVYTVPEAEIDSYDPAYDFSVKAELDKPVVESAIESVENDEVKALDPNAPMYNILGQPVGADYKGIVIQKGAKFILQ